MLFLALVIIVVLLIIRETPNWIRHHSRNSRARPNYLHNHKLLLQNQNITTDDVTGAAHILVPVESVTVDSKNTILTIATIDGGRTTVTMPNGSVTRVNNTTVMISVPLNSLDRHDEDIELDMPQVNHCT